MKINVHAGHNADGKVACGAIGLIKESTEARKVKNEVIKQLKALGHTVYDCTVDNASTVSKNLSEIVNKCNAHTVDLDISIHFNSGRNDKKGDGDNAGVEVYLYNSSSKVKSYATNVCKAVSALGFDNRGVKYSTGLYVLKHTNAPAMLIECCFVDDADDIKLYNYKTMAAAIVKGITGKTVSASGTSTAASSKKTTTSSTTKTLKKGVKVKIKSGAKDANTKGKYASFVYKTVYTVISISGDYVTFGLNNVATGKTKKSNVTVQ